MLKIAGSFALEPAQWHALAWSLRDSSAFVRSTMLAKFKKTFIKYEVRPQFLCALALPAEESRNSRVRRDCFEIWGRCRWTVVVPWTVASPPRWAIFAAPASFFLDDFLLSVLPIGNA